LSPPHVPPYPRAWLLGLILLALLLVPPTARGGKIIRYVDDQGVIWFTNIPTSPRQAAKRDRVARVRAHPYRAEVEQIARQHALNPNLVSALMSVESDFNSGALSSKGAQGLMQLMPLIAQYYRVYDPFDPQQNIAGGVRYLRDLLRLFDDRLPLALAAYNGGEGLVRKHGGVPPVLESYVNKVLQVYEQSRGTSIQRYLLPSGGILFSNVPLSQEQVAQWEVKK